MLQEITIEEAAGKLAGAIASAPEWKRFTEINGEFDKDDEVRGMLEEYQTVVAAVQAGNGQPSPEQGRQLESLQVRIQSNPLFQKREEAAQSMLDILAQANVAISSELGLDFAANAAPKQQGCCGGGEH